MEPLPPELERPSSACVLCPAPRDGAPWRSADRGYRTCSPCLDRVRETLRDIVRRYAMLDPTPGATGTGGGRGAPGFGSRSPASDHVIAMLDRRSSATARTWVAADGRVHREPERPPLSVANVLELACWHIAEHRGVAGPAERCSVDDLVRYLDAHLDWATRQDLVVDLWHWLRALQTQLRPVTGDQRARIGRCPSTLDEGEQTRECGAPLYAPTKGDTIACGSCGRAWPRPEWEQLGRMLADGAA